VVDFRSPFVAPVHRVASALVYNVSPRDVTHVVVDGEVRVRDRSLVHVDERAVLARAEEAARELVRRSGQASRLTRSGRAR
jgi:5-methylthioadenosine/S-adenosylhomocysteine deaminase